MLAYALGMGTVLSTLGIVAATTGAGVGGLSERGHVVVKKLGAVLLLAAASYVIIFWGRVAFGDVMVENSIVNAGERISGAARGWLGDSATQLLLALALGTLLLIGLAGYVKSVMRLKAATKPAQKNAEQS